MKVLIRSSMAFGNWIQSKVKNMRLVVPMQTCGGSGGEWALATQAERLTLELSLL